MTSNINIMKIKILIAPFLLFLSVVLAIWWINPAYKELKIKKATLTEATNRLADIRTKNAKAETLKEVWNKSATERDIITEYVPEQKQEEEVIDSLNTLTVQAGLGLYNLAVSGEESVAPVAPPVNVNVAGVGDGTAQIVAEPTVSNFEVTLGASGDYGKIKALLNKLVTLKRFNNISSLKISKSSKQDATAEESANGSLQLDLVVSFSYLKKDGETVSINDTVFVGGDFDLKVAEAISKKLTTEVNTVNIGLVGRENPFVK